MQWLLVETMKPILMRGMYHWSCASVPGRGTHYAAKHIKKIMQSDRRGTRYCAELDIRHYYQHIDIDVLMRALERKIKDRRFLSLVRAILETGAPGLAIGYYLCQWLANFYLEATDRYIRSLDGVHHMVRYMDNITLFGRSKRRLHKAVRAIGTYGFMERDSVIRNKSKWSKGEMARTIVLYCLRVLTLVLIWGVLIKTYAIIRWGETIGCDISDVLIYAAGAFGVELISLALKRIFAKKREEGIEDG